MPKTSKIIYVCENCGFEYSKWQGQCNACKSWNTIVESKKVVAPSRQVSNAQHTTKQKGYAGATDGIPQLLKTIQLNEFTRLSTLNGEFDRVLGGGIVPGSSILIGGNPGAGKSTLLLQPPHCRAGLT